MLPSILKIFETVIYNQLYEYCQEHRVITNSQYGFRKKHSTEYTVHLISHSSPGAFFHCKLCVAREIPAEQSHMTSL